MATIEEIQADFETAGKNFLASSQNLFAANMRATGNLTVEEQNEVIQHVMICQVAYNMASDAYSVSRDSYEMAFRRLRYESDRSRRS